jgi:uncharacterized repeat protein (TIGR01451 family)
VKYCITGGVEATFHDGSKSTEIATDAEGRSTVEIIPTTGANGATCISMELIRAECAANAEPERLSIATAATQVNWAIRDGDGSAAAAPVTPPVTPAPVTPTEPPITRPALPPTSSPALSPAAPPVAPPVQPAAAPKIGLNVTGPDSAQPGTDIRFILEITNSGNAPSPVLTVTDRYDQGLEHEKKANPLQNSLGVIGPGEKKQVGITFRVTRAGRLCHVVEVTGAGNIHETKQMCVNVAGEAAPPEPPAMSLTISTPQRVLTVGNQVLFTIDVANTGTSVPARNAQLVVHFDQGLQVERATEGAQRTGDGGVQFTFDSIEPNSHKQPQVLCTCIAQTAHTCGRVAYSDESKLNLGQETCVEIQPAPAAAAPQSNLRVQIRAVNNPVKAGATAVFHITITNAGTNPEKQVRLSLVIPESMTYQKTIASVAESKIDEKNIQYVPILEMRAGESIPFDVQLRANNSPGPAQVTAQVTSENQAQPLTDSATTTIFGP